MDCTKSSGFFPSVVFHRPTSVRCAPDISPLRKVSGFCADPMLTTQLVFWMILFLFDPSNGRNRTLSPRRYSGYALSAFVIMALTFLDCDSTSPQITLFQFLRWTSWIHSMYICMSVDPPHCLAFNRINLIGLPSLRSFSNLPSTLLCALLSMKGMSLGDRLSLMGMNE